MLTPRSGTGPRLTLGLLFRFGGILLGQASDLRGRGESLDPWLTDFACGFTDGLAVVLVAASIVLHVRWSLAGRG